MSPTASWFLRSPPNPATTPDSTRSAPRSSSQAAPGGADRLGRLGVGERQPYLVTSGQEQQQFLGFTGDDQLRSVADGGERLAVRRAKRHPRRCPAQAQPGHQWKTAAQRLDQCVVESPWLPTGLGSADVLVVNEHLPEVGNRIEKLERRIQRRAGGDLGKQVVPCGGLRDLSLHPAGVAGEERDDDSCRRIQPAFSNHKV